jgi:hypothetical protein
MDGKEAAAAAAAAAAAVALYDHSLTADAADS